MKEFVEDFSWKPGMKVAELVNSLESTGFQGIELAKAAQTIIRMKKSGAKIYFTFTSNMVTSGLRGFFAQLVKLDMVDAIITTVGGIEEDIMKATGEKFPIGSFYSDDIELYEKGMNRIGNLLISNESYAKFEDLMLPFLDKIYKKKSRYSVSEFLNLAGKHFKDKNSFLTQASKNNVPVFCPAITDGALGFHLYLFQQKHDDFIIDVVKDFKELITTMSQDDTKGLIALGGGVSKHHAILGALITGGLDYAVYMTTAQASSGSMSGATTQEAKSWGKIKDDADAATVIGDVSVMFPLAMITALEELKKQGIINGS